MSVNDRLRTSSARCNFARLGGHYESGLFACIRFFTSTTDQSVIDLLMREREVPQDLYYLAQRPSGIMFCDKRLKARQTRRFEERYGLRLKKVIAAKIAKDGFGWAPDDIVVLPCEVTTKQAADKLLLNFDIELRRFEARYGLSSEVR